MKEVAYLPLAEDIPITFNSCRKGPRGIDWRSDRDAEFTWIEAQVNSDSHFPSTRLHLVSHPLFLQGVPSQDPLNLRCEVADPGVGSGHGLFRESYLCHMDIDRCMHVSRMGEMQLWRHRRGTSCTRWMLQTPQPNPRS